MKALPMRLVAGDGYVTCAAEEATHVRINRPGPGGLITLPIIAGKRKDTGCWSWNGSVMQPTIRPSILSEGYNQESKPFRCHTWISEGNAQFLSDCDHELKSTTQALLDVPMPA